ncbi:hypothetical protein ABEW19_28075 [Paenibacillus illinoisensis]|uniref:HNH endonuclease n=1 Tax=Paenibacillus illinoisensis TaxID=59845 RepID=UPI003D26C3A0
MTFYNLTPFESKDPFEFYTELSKKKYKYRHLLIGIGSPKDDSYSESTTFKVVKECYDTYEANKEHLERMLAYSEFNDDEKEALLHCYNGGTKLLKDLKRDIINNQNIYYKSKCIYCGLGENKYMDHYLPKDLFPEFSVHWYNLIPSCSYCNEKKSMLFLNDMQIREISNPYFDRFNDEQILECKINCYEHSISAVLSQKNDIKNAICLNHIANLDLISRYNDQLPDKLSTLIFELIVNAEEFEVDSVQQKRVVNRKLVEIERIQGVNSLDAILYRAYLENDKLFEIDYLKRMYKKYIS